MFKGYVFDLDGTLINSLNTIGEAFNKQIIKQKLKPIELKKYNYLVGDGPKVLTERAVEYLIKRDNFNLTNFEKSKLIEILYKDYMDYYLKMDDIYSKAFNGIKESLDYLKENNKIIGICTNKPMEATKIVVENVFGKDYFNYIIGLEEKYNEKPDPQMMKVLMDKLNLKNEEIAYFGDTSTDMLTAKNLNIYAVGVTWGFRTKDELIKYGADRIIENPLEIKNI